MGLLFGKSSPSKDERSTATGDQNHFANIDVSHVDTLEFVKSETMTSDARVFALCDAVNYLCKFGIAGDVVECGVWKGGSMMAIAKTLIRNQDLNRQLWLYDTFSGMSLPSEHDIDFQGNDAKQLLEHSDPEDNNSIWCFAAIDEVRLNLARTGFPDAQIEYVVGEVEKTLLQAENKPEKIALLRLDTDWYESTRIELEQLFPKLVPGGVLIIDDFGHWEGCRRAVEDYIDKNQIQILLNRIDYTGRIGIKQEDVGGREFLNVT